MAAPFRGFLTSHNGSSVNFLGDGTIFWGGRQKSLGLDWRRSDSQLPV